MELHIHNTTGSRFFCPTCGKAVRTVGKRHARWSCSTNEATLRFNISAVIPLLTCENCGKTDLTLPWEQSGFRCEEQTEETGQLENAPEYA